MLKKVMLTVAIALVGLLSAQIGSADDYVNGYYRANGTYVQPYYQSNADGNVYNNYSTYPNVNPYTGQVGTHHYPGVNLVYGATPDDNSVLNAAQALANQNLQKQALQQQTANAIGNSMQTGFMIGMAMAEKRRNERIAAQKQPGEQQIQQFSHALRAFHPGLPSWNPEDGTTGFWTPGHENSRPNGKRLDFFRKANKALGDDHDSIIALAVLHGIWTRFPDAVALHNEPNKRFTTVYELAEQTILERGVRMKWHSPSVRALREQMDAFNRGGLQSYEAQSQIAPQMPATAAANSAAALLPQQQPAAQTIAHRPN
jgi:hypothetical protein